VGCGIWREEEWRVEFVPARDEGGTRERRALRVYAGEQRAGGLGAWCLQEKKITFWMPDVSDYYPYPYPNQNSFFLIEFVCFHFAIHFQFEYEYEFHICVLNEYEFK
jgi:hypothetical protein